MDMRHRVTIRLCNRVQCAIFTTGRTCHGHHVAHWYPAAPRRSNFGEQVYRILIAIRGLPALPLEVASNKQNVGVVAHRLDAGWRPTSRFSTRQTDRERLALSHSREEDSHWWWGPYASPPTSKNVSQNGKNYIEQALKRVVCKYWEENLYKKCFSSLIDKQNSQEWREIKSSK